MKKSDKITRRDGKFILDLREIGGGRETHYTMEEAMHARDQAYADKQNGVYIPRTSNPNFGDAKKAFLSFLNAKYKAGDLSEDRWVTHRRNIQFLLDNVAGLRLHKIIDIDAGYIEERVVPALFRQAHATGLQRYDTLRQLLKYCVKRNWARANPCREVDLPKRKIEHKPPPRISVEDIKAIIANAGDYALRIKFAAGTGVRAGEQLACGWDNLDLDAETYNVTHARDKSGALGSVKTKAGVRSIQLPPKLVKDLKEWKLAQPLEQRSRGLVFPTLAGNMADVNNWRKRGLHPACIAAGIEPIRWHDLRHFYASVLLFSSKFTDAQITQFLGHTSIDFTRKQYAHWFKDPRRDKTIADEIAAVIDL